MLSGLTEAAVSYNDGFERSIGPYYYSLILYKYDRACEGAELLLPVVDVGSAPSASSRLGSARESTFLRLGSEAYSTSSRLGFEKSRDTTATQGGLKRGHSFHRLLTL